MTTNLVNGQTLNGNVTWTAVVLNGSPTSLEYLVDNSIRWTENAAPFQFNGDPSGLLATPTLSNGSHALQIVARNGSTVIGTKSLSVNVQNSSPTPTPPPAATPTPAATPAPTPPPTATPTPTPVASCPTSLQSAINAASTGATVNVTGCTFRESVTIGKSLTLKGGTIDGQNARFGLRVRAAGVTIDGTTVYNTVEGSIYEGGLDVRGFSGSSTIRNARVYNSTGSCVYVEAATAVISSSNFGPCGVTGLHLQRSNNTTITDTRLHHTNTRQLEPGNESGGMKAVESSGVVVTRVEADNNYGPGVWFDGQANNATVRDSRIHDNSRPGIHFEISSGATITGNEVWRNGWGFANWAWGAGILLSSSGNAEVANNVVAWNADGISIISQARSDRAPTVNISVHDNTVFSSDSSADSARFGIGWVQDWSGTLFSSGTGNSGANNRYWYSSAEGTLARFAWNGTHNRLTNFQATPGDEPGRYLTTAEKDSILSGASLPTAP